MQPLVLRRLGQRRVGLGERAPGVAAVQPVGDHHHAGGDVARRLGDHRLGHGHRRRAVAVAVVDGRLQRPRLRVLRRELEGALRALGRGGEVLGRERQRGALLVAVEARAVEVDEEAVLGERAGGVAAVAQQPGVAEPRLLVLAVQPEDVAELDRGAVGLALGEQRHGALVVLLGALLLAVAGREPDRGDDEKGGEEGAQGHGILRR